MEPTSVCWKFRATEDKLLQQGPHTIKGILPQEPRCCRGSSQAADGAKLWLLPLAPPPVRGTQTRPLLLTWKRCRWKHDRAAQESQAGLPTRESPLPAGFLTGLKTSVAERQHRALYRLGKHNTALHP